MGRQSQPRVPQDEALAAESLCARQQPPHRRRVLARHRRDHLHARRRRKISGNLRLTSGDLRTISTSGDRAMFGWSPGASPGNLRQSRGDLEAISKAPACTRAVGKPASARRAASSRSSSPPAAEGASKTLKAMLSQWPRMKAPHSSHLFTAEGVKRRRSHHRHGCPPPSSHRPRPAHSSPSSRKPHLFTAAGVKRRRSQLAVEPQAAPEQRVSHLRVAALPRAHAALGAEAALAADVWLPHGADAVVLFHRDVPLQVDIPPLRLPVPPPRILGRLGKDVSAAALLRARVLPRALLATSSNLE